MDRRRKRNGGETISCGAFGKNSRCFQKKESEYLEIFDNFLEFFMIENK